MHARRRKQTRARVRFYEHEVTLSIRSDLKRSNLLPTVALVFSPAYAQTCADLALAVSASFLLTYTFQSRFGNNVKVRAVAQI